VPDALRFPVLERPRDLPMTSVQIHEPLADRIVGECRCRGAAVVLVVVAEAGGQ
jgi:hypothetical protein